MTEITFSDLQDYLVRVTYFDDRGRRQVHQAWIMAEAQADAWPQGMEIVEAVSREAGVEIISCLVEAVPAQRG